MSPLRRLALAIAAAITALAAMEGAAHLYYRAAYGQWMWGSRVSAWRVLFRRHPWLVLAPRPSASFQAGGLTFSHNSRGFRGAELPPSRPPGPRRVVCYGGSSTYGIGVDDAETWPVHLQRQLGAGYQVVNAGVPGYSTAEAIIQTALQQHDLRPDVCVYSMGWNDLQSQHVQDLAPDYSDFHAARQASLLVPSRSALLTLAHGVLRRLTGEERYVPRGEVRSSVDERALAIYRGNLESLVALCRARGIVPVLVPQVMNYRALTGEGSYGWIPFVRDRDVEPLMRAYNATMADVAARTGAAYAASALAEPWSEADFIDMGHLTPAGGRKLARIVAETIAGLDRRSPY